MLINIKNEAFQIHNVAVLANDVPFYSLRHKKQSQSQVIQTLKYLFLSIQSGVVLS